jgi:hypothetical protein
MSTIAQIEANRENSQHSTGPVTAEGKAASSQNHFKHGFCSRFRVLEYEKDEDYDALLNALREEHQPSTPTEQILVDRMAEHHWLAQRAEFLQSDIFCESHPGRDDQKLLALYFRYQTQNDRAFSKCLNDLLKLRAEKRKAEIGFEREKQKAAEEARKQQAHEAKTCLATSRAQQPELDFNIKDFIQARLPGHTEIPFSTLKDVLARSIEEFAAQLDANPALVRSPKAA